MAVRKNSVKTANRNRGRLEAQHRKDNSSASLWRAPEIAACGGPREAKESIHNPVLEPNHSVKYALKPVQRFSEGQEVQAVLTLLAPGHGSPQHEGRWLETFLC